MTTHPTKPPTPAAAAAGTREELLGAIAHHLASTSLASTPLEGKK